MRARARTRISVTGNVLRDYLTDLFPILELGTSAKMLSIVPLLAGGGLYETGAGGSAPKHVQQFLEENYLRWDSLGEFLALQVSIEDLAAKTGNAQGEGAGRGAGCRQRRSSSRTTSRRRARSARLDNRGSHFYLALYWAQALAAQAKDAGAAAAVRAGGGSADGERGEDRRRADRRAGQATDVGGYYHPSPAKCSAAMRPSATLNGVLATLAG